MTDKSTLHQLGVLFRRGNGSKPDSTEVKSYPISLEYFSAAETVATPLPRGIQDYPISLEYFSAKVLAFSAARPR